MDKRPITLLEKLEIERRRRVADKLLEIEGTALSQESLARRDQMDELGLTGEDRIEYIKTAIRAELEAADASRSSAQ